MFSNIIERIYMWSPRKIFLADAIGAFMTSALLGLVLVNFNTQLGLSKQVFYSLTLLVVPYFIYSLSVYLLKPNKWSSFLKGIALANVFYCVITISVIILNYEEVTILGMIYFLGEASLISTIAFIEWNYALINKGRRMLG